MKKIKYYLLLSFLTLSFSMKSQSQKKEEKNIQPFIISTDLFAPWSVGIEKIFKEKYAIKFRYHKSALIKDFYGDGFLSTNISSLQSYMLEFKYYPYEVKNKKFNSYIGAYGKVRDTIRHNYGSESIINTITGLNIGALGIYKHISLEVNLGGGLSFYYFKNKNVSPIDIRMNVSLGVPLY